MQKLKLINLYKGSYKYRLYAIFSDEGYFHYYQVDKDVILDLRDLKELGYRGNIDKIPVFYKIYELDQHEDKGE